MSTISMREYADTMSVPISDDGSATLDWLSDEGLLDWVSVEADCD